MEILPSDRIIMCTDGLSTVILDENIGEVARQFEQPEEVCQELLQQTLSGGAPDNVTIVTIHYKKASKKKLPQLARKS